jgi:hypothetical protein
MGREFERCLWLESGYGDSGSEMLISPPIPLSRFVDPEQSDQLSPQGSPHLGITGSCSGSCLKLEEALEELVAGVVEGAVEGVVEV